MKNEPKIEPFPLSGNGHLHIENKSIEVHYCLVGLYPNAIGGGFLVLAEGKPLPLTWPTAGRLQIGVERSLKVLVGGAMDDRVPVVSFGFVETENDEE